jgi:hypothetical protein
MDAYTPAEFIEEDSDSYITAEGLTDLQGGHKINYYEGGKTIENKHALYFVKEGKIKLWKRIIYSSDFLITFRVMFVIIPKEILKGERIYCIV